MSWEDIEQRWERYRGQLQDRWGRLTEDDLETARASRNDLVERVRDRYGIDRDMAERHVDDWIHTAL
jgi:uncharacterized protein YjbJ (UPF0337 family)